MITKIGATITSLKKVFLGGTCNNSTWRDKIIKKLKINYFNPVVDDWNEASQKKELEERATSDFVLYCITPKMTGVYSIAEVVDDANNQPKKTIFCYLHKDEDKEFNKAQMKSLDMVGKMIVKRGGKWFNSLDKVVRFLNNAN